MLANAITTERSIAMADKIFFILLPPQKLNIETSEKFANFRFSRYFYRYIIANSSIQSKKNLIKYILFYTLHKQIKIICKNSTKESYANFTLTTQRIYTIYMYNIKLIDIFANSRYNITKYEIGVEFMEVFPTVSVVIPIHNEERYIEACLDSLLNQDYPMNLVEAILVDGMSTDSTRSIIEEKYTSKYSFIKMIDNPEKSVQYALNYGIKAAKNE